MSNVKTAEVVIIGGGVIGLTVARALALRGIDEICLIERSEIGTEASTAAAGMLAPQAEADSIDEFFSLGCQSRDLYPNFVSSLLEETGIDVELDTTGTLYVALDDEDQRQLVHRYAWQTRAGLVIERLDADDTLRLEPHINPTLRGALLFANDIQVENRRLVAALSNSIAKLKVNVVTGTQADSIGVRNGRIEKVNTPRCSISCRTVIVAAGCWSSQLNLEGGKVWRTRWQVQPVRGQMICFEAKPQITRHVIYSSSGYIVPRRDGRLLAGSTSEDAGFAKVTTGGGINSILTNAIQISPSISNLPILDSWAGLRPKAPDGLPVIGPYDEINGLFYATGHYRNGILLAPITGELIAQALVEGSRSKLLNQFGPERFQLTGVA